MLLRRVIEHVKAQNWTAVALDFVIVVLGVFMGLQAQQWFEARNFDAAERTYLAELRAEITANAAMTDSRHEIMNIVVRSGNSAVDFLQADEPCTAQCRDLLVDFFHASQVLFAPQTRTVYEEMQRLGLPRSDAVAAAAAAYYQYDSGLSSSIDTNPAFRVRVRGHIPPAAQRALWRDCHSVENAVEVLDADCKPDINPETARTIIENIRADKALLNELIYWVGMNQHWSSLFSDLNAYGAQAVAAIDIALGE